MSVRVFNNILNASNLLKLQNSQYSEKILLEDTVPAGQSKLGKTAISNLGHFLCLHITGMFSTLRDTGEEGVIDDPGVNYLRGQLTDGNGQKKLFNDYIPFPLWMSPGRVKSASATDPTAGDPSNNLFYPQEFEYLFAANSDILLDVKNDGNYDQTYSICFHGIRILAKASVQGL